MLSFQAAARNRGADLVRNIAVLAILWLAYSKVRTLTSDDLSSAMSNAAHLREFERALGLPSELAMQSGVIRSHNLMRAANTYYLAVHFPATFAFLTWVWLRHRPDFNRIRNVLVTVTGIGLILHVAYPLAPPRMIDGFVDTAEVFGPNPYDMGVARTANQIAAMPSLHVGWAMLVAFGIIWVMKSRWRWLVLAHPAITIAVVVLTANHYWIDAIVAIILVAAAWKVFERGPASTEISDLRFRAREFQVVRSGHSMAGSEAI